MATKYPTKPVTPEPLSGQVAPGPNEPLVMKLTLSRDGTGRLSCDVPTDEMIVILGMLEMAKATFLANHARVQAAAAGRALALPGGNGAAIPPDLLRRPGMARRMR